MLVATVGFAPLVTAASFLFVDVSASRGFGSYLPAVGMGSGVACADYDNDGDVDCYVPQASGATDQLYKNLGGGFFTDVAADVGLARSSSSRVALWIDYDGDRDLDLFVANDSDAAVSTFTLYRQDTADHFTDVTVDAGVSRLLTVNPNQQRGGMCAGDINNDGFLDIFAARWPGPAHLFLNTGQGAFTDISESSGVSAAGVFMHQPMMADFNNDGWLDIYVAVDFAPNSLWINQHDNTFVDLAGSTGAANAMNDMGMALGDVDNDGDFDIYVTNIFSSPENPDPNERNVLLRNDSVGASPAFVEIATAVGVDNGHWGWGTTFLDADRDGLLDIVATNGWRSGSWVADPSRCFRNVSGSTAPFEDVSDEVQFNDTFYGSCLVAADFDRDGDQDLLQTTMEGGPLRLLDNQFVGSEPQNHFLIVKPRMLGPNHRAIGAIVRVTTGSITQSRLITAGCSYLGQEPAEAFFGLGQNTLVDQVTVEWPGGGTTMLSDLSVDRFLTITGPNAAIPTVSSWGLCISVLTTIVASTILFRRYDSYRCAHGSRAERLRITSNVKVARTGLSKRSA